MFTIGAFARLAGISAKQLRAYDGLGLFRPAWVDPASGYRFYSPSQLPELRRVLGLRQLGISLEEIGALASGGDLRAALETRQAQLERERRNVEERLRALSISIADEAGPDVVIRPVSAEPVATMRVGADVGAAFYELESHVRDARRRAPRPPGALPDSREIFVPVTGPIPTTDRIGYQRLPACRVASIIHRGSYGGMAAARQTLYRWVTEAGLEPNGPPRVLYLQFGAEPELRVPPGYVVQRDADFVTELQQPIA